MQRINIDAFRIPRPMHVMGVFLSTTYLSSKKVEIIKQAKSTERFDKTLDLKCLGEPTYRRKTLDFYNKFSTGKLSKINQRFKVHVTQFCFSLKRVYLLCEILLRKNVWIQINPQFSVPQRNLEISSETGQNTAIFVPRPSWGEWVQRLLWRFLTSSYPRQEVRTWEVQGKVQLFLAWRWHTSNTNKTARSS